MGVGTFHPLFRLKEKNQSFKPMLQKKYRGVVVPMVTPVTEQGRVDVPAVERIIGMFAQNGVAPLLLGTTGEGNSVAKDEAVALVSSAVRAANHRILIYAGLTGNCFSEQLVQAEAYHQAGADVIVATLPTYYALTPQQMLNYYTMLADSITGPLMLYNILATTHMSIPLDVVRQLADHPNIVGLKDSERNIERMTECIAFTKERPDFSFFCGCSKERVERALISIGPKDIREMIGDGKSIETGCSFCGKKYVFSIADLEKIYAIQMEKRKRQQEDS